MLALAAGPYPHERGQRLLALPTCGPVFLLRRWPLPALATMAAADGLVMASGNASLPFGLMLGMAVYLVAARLPRRVSIRAAAATAVAMGAALAYAALAVRGASPAAEAVAGFLPAAAAWFVGDSVAARRRYLAGLAEQAERERTAEAERARQQVQRVVQEALTNVVKHAPGAHASVDLTVSAQDVRIEVADDGGPLAGSAGPEGRPAIRGTGHGIVGMRERIGAFGGWLVAEPLEAEGFRVFAEIPVEGAV